MLRFEHCPEFMAFVPAFLVSLFSCRYPVVVSSLFFSFHQLSTFWRVAAPVAVALFGSFSFLFPRVFNLSYLSLLREKRAPLSPTARLVSKVHRPLTGGSAKHQKKLNF